MLLTATMMLLASCSGSDYVNAIPEGSIAIISVDAAQVASQTKYGQKAHLLMSMLQVANPTDCGIDLSAKMYLFEAADGNLGIAAKVSSGSKMEKWIGNLAAKGQAQPLTKKNGSQFTVLRNNWVVGFSDQALLMMGPALGHAQTTLMQQMSRYLSQDEENSIKVSPLYARLDSIKSGIAMVAQAQALPEKFVSLFTLGAPKDADASQVVIAAEMEVKDGCLCISGETFSFNKRIDQALKESDGVFRPIKGDYTKAMSQDAVMGVFMNVQGDRFLKLMQQDKGLTTMLAGINAAIDMDNIIRSVDGDMAIIVPSYGESFDMNMGARLANTQFLADVSYWKTSCPEGGRLMDTGKQSWCYSNGQTVFHFGLTPDRQFYLGSTPETARQIVTSSSTPIREGIQQMINGQKMVTVINLGKVDNEVTQMLTAVLEPIFGKLNALVYQRK